MSTNIERVMRKTRLRGASDLGLNRFYVLAAWSVGLAGALVWSTTDWVLSLGLYFIALGGATAVSGAGTTVRYLRSAPAEGHDG